MSDVAIAPNAPADAPAAPAPRTKSRSTRTRSIRRRRLTASCRPGRKEPAGQAGWRRSTTPSRSTRAKTPSRRRPMPRLATTSPPEPMEEEKFDLRRRPKDQPREKGKFVSRELQASDGPQQTPETRGMQNAHNFPQVADRNPNCPSTLPTGRRRRACTRRRRPKGACAGERPRRSAPHGA